MNIYLGVKGEMHMARRIKLRCDTWNTHLVSVCQPADRRQGSNGHDSGIPRHLTRLILAVYPS